MTIYMACTLTLTTMGAITSMFNTQNPLRKKRGSNCLKPVDQYLFFILKDSKVFLFAFENIQRPAQHRRCLGHLKGTFCHLHANLPPFKK
jgi:hypothetical protein